MLIRIVRLTFNEENISSFEQIFEESKEHIRNFEGCQHLELYQDIDKPFVFFTYSYWENEGALNTYRKSDFFKSTWAKTKKLFSAKPEAWSVEKVNG